MRKTKCKNCNKFCISYEKESLCVSCLKEKHEKESKRKCHHCGLFKIPKKKRWGRLCDECRLDDKISRFYINNLIDIENEIEEEGMIFPIPETATDAIPGSEEKIEIMKKRAEQKVQLFHPLDKNGIIESVKLITKLMNRSKKHDNGTCNCRTPEEFRNSKREFHYSGKQIHNY